MFAQSIARSIARSPARAGVLRGLGRPALIAVLALAVAACTSGASPSPSPEPTDSPSPTTGAGALVLDRAPADTGCDAMGVDYRAFTIRIDPAGSPQIWAETDTGATLQVKWDPSFVGGDADNPVVMDSTGAVVAEDGTEVELPAAAWPELVGHFVCTGPTSIIVLDQSPA